MAKKIKNKKVENKGIKPRTVAQIERKIAKLEEEIDEYRSYDLTLPSIQSKIRSRRSMIWGLLYALRREKEYDAKKYLGDWF